MKHYKDTNDLIRAIDESDEEQLALVGDDWTELSEAELDKALNPPLTPEQEREVFKAERAAIVADITVTTPAGNTFDGDEDSQGRIARALLVMTDQDTVNWVLADNSVIDTTKNELQEALRLAGEAQAAIWVQGGTM